MDSTVTPQETVERALAAAKGGDCIVIAGESSTANLRWAASTLTTNGVATTRSLTVIAIDRRGDGPGGAAGVGVVTRSGITPGQVEDVVLEAEKAAAGASPAEDTGALVRADSTLRSGENEWPDLPAGTSIGVFRTFAAELGETLHRRGRRGARRRAGAAAVLAAAAGRAARRAVEDLGILGAIRPAMPAQQNRSRTRQRDPGQHL